MRIAHLIAHAESVPHYVPSLSRWLLCAPAARERLLSKEAPLLSDSDIQMVGERNVEQGRLGAISTSQNF